ncbi:MAG: class I SAM-dependent methyltransferase [Candidatus Saccharimonadales bacterium]
MTNTDQHWSGYYNQGKDFGLMTSQALTKLLSYVDGGIPKTNLDIGCGTGQLTRELYHRGYSCVGVDASAKAVEIARSLTVREGLEYQHFDIEVGNPTELPKHPYSLITCKLVYAFIKEKPTFLHKVAALLSEGGKFVVITPLLSDVPPEKAGIAVDLEQATAELLELFSKVEPYQGQGVAYLVCGK